MKTFWRSRVLPCLLMAVWFTVPVLAQNPVDPGPRPVGTVSAAPFCPDAASGAGDFRSKFPGAQPCVDVVQPKQQPTDTTGAGNVVPAAGNLTTTWFWALAVFETPAAVAGSPQTGGATIPGLGPSFNATSCFECHSQPAVGGSSPNNQTPNFNNTFFPGNPQVGDAPDATQLQNVSQFVSLTGPVREARFVNGVAPATANTAAVQPGSVAELFVTNASDPTNCKIDQEPFPAQLAANNVIFRIPIPTFGDGFVEAVPDENLVSNLSSEIAIAGNLNLFPPNGLGIQGHLNRNGNDNTISRFGWKAQNKSLLLFAGEAANVEMGVTNELFQNERTVGNGRCTPNGVPEDQVFAPPVDPNSRSINGILNAFGGPTTNQATAAVVSDISSSIENFAVFMRLNAAPSVCNYNSGLDTTGKAVCNPLDASASRGQQLFGSVGLAPAVANSIPRLGCVLCHTDILTTGPSQNGNPATATQTFGLDRQTFHPFSDFALHNMDGLGDGISQGLAGPNEFRTAPLWGVGQRLFFLHDGRDADLLQAIQDHCLPTPPATTSNSEACATVNRFNTLIPGTSGATCQPDGTNCVASQQDLLNFLRSL